MENLRDEKTPGFVGIFGIVREAIKLPLTNPSFIGFTFITYLTLFCIMIIPNLPFEPTRLRDALVTLQQLNSHPNILISLTSWLLEGTIRVGIVQISKLFTFLATVTVIDSASTIYKAGAGRPIGVRDLLRNSFKYRWGNSFFVYIVMNLISNISLDAVLLYGTAGPLSSLRNEWAPPLHFFSQVGVDFVRRECSTWWQVALVVSVLEEDKLQFDAFFTSAKLRKGNRFTGFVLMLLYFGWCSLPNLLGLKRWSFTSGVAHAFVDRSWFCLGEVMNWVACTIYYHDCKIRQRWNEEEVIAKED